jgi:DNA-directed RNA polymerase I and III subunit RPAC1
MAVNGEDREMTRLEVQQSRVVCGPDENKHGGSFDASTTFATASLEEQARARALEQPLSIEVTRVSPSELECELHSAPAPIVNALRRILLAEVPTMAIEKVFIRNNTSPVNDESLAHRLGLVPILADARRFHEASSGSSFTESNCIAFRLHAYHSRDSDDAELLSDGSARAVCVYSKQLEHLPRGSDWPPEEEEAASKLTQFSSSQSDVFSPVNNDILLAKLGPGQEIDLHAIAMKGRGSEHAKWSPVGTAWYRLVPEVKLLRRLSYDEASELVRRAGRRCSCYKAVAGGIEEVVQRPRGCTFCREMVRTMSGESGWDNAIQLRKLKHSFIFTIESTGCIPAAELFKQAVHLLRQKCQDNKSSL